MKGFSIIICCYNSSKKLPETVKYISNLKPVKNASFELIIIDNNSTDITKEVVLKLTQTYSSIDIVFDTELNVGKVNAFNRAVKLSRFKYLIICDDDNLLHEDYLQIAFDTMESDTKIGVAGARGILSEDIQLPLWFPIVENAWAIGKQANVSGEIKGSMPSVWGAGMVLRKSAWNEVLQKGFSSFLTGRKSDRVTMAGEDTEMCLLINRLGYKVYYNDSLFYTHNISQGRLNWKNFKKLWEGFARSSVYFDLYNFYFTSNKSINPADIKRKFRDEVKSNLLLFLKAMSLLNFLKIVFITFIQDRPGYLPGIEKRKFLYRLKELWRIRNAYGTYFRIVSNIRM